MSDNVTQKLKAEGLCIYCGESDVDKLSDEHIIPLGLGGRIVLPKASCLKCNKKTSSIEGAILRGVLRDFRVVAKAPSRRKHPSTLSLTTISGDGSYTVSEVRPEEHPGPVIFPILAAPQIFSGSQDNSLISIAFGFVGGMPVTAEPTVFEGKIDIPLDRFCQFLAKVAHSFAVSMVGLTGFAPCLNQFILEKSGPHFRWVGGAENSPFEPDTKGSHQLKVDTLTHKGTVFCVVYLRFFANFPMAKPSLEVVPMPTYLIVVGKANRFTLARIEKPKW